MLISVLAPSSLFAAQASPRGKVTVAAAAACFPSCLEDLKAMCTPTGTCTKNAPATQTDTSVAYYCFVNGVKIASSLYNETRSKPDGSVCYAADVVVDGTGTMYQYLWKNGAGTLVATESFNYNDMGGRYHTVVCGGASYTVDMGSAECQAEQMQQNPDADVICAADASCKYSTAGAGGAGGGGGGTAGAGGAPAAGGHGGGAAATGGAAAAGGATGLAGAGGTAGTPGTAGAAGTAGAGGAPMVCPSGEVACSGACVNPLTDAANCGACGHLCGAALVCASGVCASSCAAGTLMCGADCKPANSPQTCGSCTAACASGQICCSGPLSADGVCSDAATVVPSATYACQTCPGKRVTCDGACIDLQFDDLNCGRCGNACGGGHPCISGACEIGSCAVVSPRRGDAIYGLIGVALFVAAVVATRRRRTR
ncbi:MAG TPA: hypothetical protein VGP07_15560 [Polyangia bacterium]